MEYSVNTIKRTIAAEKAAYLAAMEKFSIDPDSIKVHVSTGNIKVHDTLNISLLPVLDCTNCKTCIKNCYALKAIFSKGYNHEKNSVLKAWAENSVIAHYKPGRFISEVLKAIKANGCKFFRFHVAGDIFSWEYLYYIVELANQAPGTKFQFFTKSFDIVNSYVAENGPLPNNIVLMFSGWPGVDISDKNPFNFPIFSPVTPSGVHGIPENWPTVMCPGNCELCEKNCLGCYNAKPGTGVLVPLH